MVTYRDLLHRILRCVHIYDREMVPSIDLDLQQREAPIYAALNHYQQ